MAVDDGMGVRISSPIRWSILAGLWMFGWGTLVALALSDLMALLADVIGLPAPYWMVALASPALVVGAVTWWALVERRGAYTYRVGGAFGLLTALVTWFLWTGRFVSVWGLEMLAVRVVAILAAVVLAVVGVAGVIVGLPVMYVRRRAAGLGSPTDPQ